MALVDKHRLEASICRDSFYDFVQRFWEVIIPEKPVWNWHIEVLCHHCQEVAERVFAGRPKTHDLVINVPPGTTKSTICSIMFPAWVWTRMPSARVISSSHSHALAMNLSRKSRDIVQSEKYTQLFPNIRLRDDQNTKAHFENTQGGLRYAVGTDGTVIGYHAHFIIVDDPIDPQSAVSEAELKSANRFISETLSTRKVDKAISVTVLIMQRLHQNDPSQMLLDESKNGGTPVRHIKLPGEAEGNPREVVRPRKYAKFYKDGLLDPVRLDRKVLKGLKIRLGQYGYAGQIRQEPVPLGGGMFKIDRLTIGEKPPPLRHFSFLVRYWDKAGTEGGGAHTAGVLMGRDAKGMFWVLDVVRGQWDSGRREAIIQRTAKLDTDAVIVGVEQEPGSGGKESAQGTVRRLAGYRVRVVRPTGDKVIRADPFSVQVNDHNVAIAPGEWNREYLSELQHFPFSKYKDQVDASSGAFELLTRPRKRAGGLW